MPRADDHGADRSPPAAVADAENTDTVNQAAEVYDDTVRQDPRATVQPPTTLRGVGVPEALGVLERLAASGLRSIRSRVEIAETLGQGGMGVVQRARQVALGRDVAVKSLRREKRTPEATAELLREAWITGSLEHPNVVPIHGMEIDEAGFPFIVLKHIDGVTWAELMHRPDEIERRFGETDLLAWNLSILSQVLNAIRYAHSRGIVHRDLKPDNVMIGEFGEVYVLDWGIAVSLHDDGSGRLPLARDAHEMAGTPAYMAPEMLGGSAHAISERTDLYLIGATLYEIIAGAPPHIGLGPLELLVSVAESRPHMPAEAPPGLADICRRAMAPDPELRYPGAEEMQRAIGEFLRNRGAAKLAERALADAEALERLLDGTKVGTEAHREQVYRLYGACRFGFLEALATWANNRTARDGMIAASEAMISYELSQGDARAAAALLADLTQVARPRAELREAVARALDRTRAERKRVARLERLDRDLDLSVGSRARVGVLLIALTVWTVAPLFSLFYHVRDDYPGNGRLAVWSFLSVVGFLTVVAVARKSLLATAVNRKLVAVVALMMTSQGIIHVVNHLAGFLPVVGQTYQLFLWFSVLTLVAVTVERRLAPAAAGYLAAFLVAALWPDIRFLAMAGGNAVVAVNAAIIWSPGRAQQAAAEAAKP